MADPVTTTIMMVASTALDFMGSMQQASAVKQEANYNAAIQKAEAKSEYAKGTLRSQEEIKKGELLASQALARSAKGGGASDVGVQNIIGDIEGEAGYNSLMRAYEGKQAYTDLNANAAMTRALGKYQSKAIKTKAVATALGDLGKIGGSKMFDKYWPKSSASPSVGWVDWNAGGGRPKESIFY